MRIRKNLWRLCRVRPILCYSFLLHCLQEGQGEREFLCPLNFVCGWKQENFFKLKQERESSDPDLGLFLIGRPDDLNMSWIELFPSRSEFSSTGNSFSWAIVREPHERHDHCVADASESATTSRNDSLK